MLYLVPVAGGAGRGLFFQTFPDMFPCGAAVHEGMEGCAALAQGMIEFRRQEQREKGTVEFHMAGQEAQADADRNEGDGKGGDEFQCEGGDKSNLEHLEGGGGKGMADFLQTGFLSLFPAEELQGEQSLQEFGELRIETEQLLPLLLVGNALSFYTLYLSVLLSLSRIKR